jgi:hypothetical protein
MVELRPCTRRGQGSGAYRKAGLSPLAASGLCSASRAHKGSLGRQGRRLLPVRQPVMKGDPACLSERG